MFRARSIDWRLSLPGMLALLPCLLTGAAAGQGDAPVKSPREGPQPPPEQRAQGNPDEARDPTGLGVAGNDEVREHIRNFQGKGAIGVPSAKLLPLAEALAAFRVADDLKLELVAHEPEVRQPLFISFDERGRMWVLQYLQYPFPAGLKVVKYDEYLRAVFDKVPPPPPNHFRGRDKITIHEDTDGDGRFDKHTTFLDGLNIATSFARGRGGVWVLNPPYLLFYPDRDDNDVPDGDPEVHLQGFGLEDTHSVANSLCWGPDGWLYGAHGSTVHATITRPGLDDPRGGLHFKGQGVWRYHPEARRFELFAEGGGNTFGVEFDAQGRVFSGHNGGDTRGFHYAQGGYHRKSWGKHGPLTNPFALGWFEAMPHAKVERFSHTFVIYEGGALPERFHGRLLAPVPLHHYVTLSNRLPLGGTFRTEDVEKVVTTPDPWFRPVDIKAGPDGAVYLADWCDTRLSHVDPRDTWDRETGRVYRLTAKDARPAAPLNLGRLGGAELVDMLGDANKWRRQTALRLLADRARTDPRQIELAPRLRKTLSESGGQPALEALWALHAIGAFDDDLAGQALGHASADVRRWAARLAVDKAVLEGRALAPRLVSALQALADTEPAAETRGQLASSAKRLPGPAGLELAWRLLRRNEDAGDPYIPLLLWWAVESRAVSARADVLARFNTAEAWNRPLVREFIQARLVERWVGDPREENLLAAAEMLRGAPGVDDRKALLGAINRAFSGRALDRLPPALADAMLWASGAAPNSLESLSLRLRAGDDAAHAAALALVADDRPEVKERRLACLQLLGQVGRPEAAPALLRAAFTSQWHSVRREALAALQRFGDEAIGAEIAARYQELPADQGVRPRAIEVLSTRKASADALLRAVESGGVPRTDVSTEVIERVKLHGDETLTARAHKLWGRTRATPKEIAAQITRVAGLLRSGEATSSPDSADRDPAAARGALRRGQALFEQTCGKCHKLFGKGQDLGPDLTGYERGNLDFLLTAILDPSAAIREEFTTFQVITTDGRVVTGFLEERGQTTVTLRTVEQGALILPLDEIESGPKALPTSLMPEKVLGELTDEQIRDLFAYLRAPAPPADKP